MNEQYDIRYSTRGFDVRRRSDIGRIYASITYKHKMTLVESGGYAMFCADRMYGPENVRDIVAGPTKA